MNLPLEPTTTSAGHSTNSTGARVDAIICLILAALTFAVFGQTARYEFVNFDDDVYVYDNPAVANGVTLNGLEQALIHGSFTHWDPLTTFSRMLDCQIYGLHSGGHHVTNVLLHMASVVLLFLILRRVTGALWRSAFVAAVFAIHPLRVESVAWVTERKDVLSGLFFMLTLGAYARYARHPRLPGYLLVLLFFTCGLMSKAMLITVPFLLLLLDYWPLNRFDWSNPTDAWRLILEKLPLLAPAIATLAATISAQGEAIQNWRDLPLTSRGGNALLSLVIYVRQMFYPAGLAVYYPYPSHGLAVWSVILAALAVAGISVIVLLWRKRRPYLLVGWFWYAGMLIPVLGLVPLGGQARADRFTYLPQIGLYLALTWLAGSLFVNRRHRGMILGLAAGLVIAALGVSAFRQTLFWRDSETLWTRALACTRDNELANYNMGLALVAEGRLDQAVPFFREAVRITPNAADARNDLASALRQTGHLDEAIAEFQQALLVNPADASVHLNLANALYQAKRVEDALSEYHEALRRDPEYADAEDTLGYVLLELRRLDEAVTHLQRALQIQPNHLDALYNLGRVRERQGQRDEAIRMYEKALVLRPDYGSAKTRLADLVWRLATSADPTARDGAKALDVARGLVALSGGQPAMLRVLAAALAETGNYAEAATCAEQALRLARTAGDAELARHLQQELTRYQAGQPLREAATAPPASAP